MHIRIISGKYKGRRLTAPKNLPIRPTTDRAKEALFNILNNYVHIPQVKVLDLFTGSGSIAYEFASRGAKDIQAVDKNFQVTKFVKQTAQSFDFPIKVIKYETLTFLEKTSDRYDIIFADPPYDLDPELQKKMIQIVFERQLLNEDGFFILEHKEQLSFEDQPHFKFSKQYGQTVFSFFQ
jgi:16S rRNA (guanine(966)-N(2))-methyltransferase RsmD